jgi:hypothetical protein
VGRLAIVIPSAGSVEALESTLLSVLENRPARSEIVVVHAHPYNDPYQLEGEVRLVKAPAKSNFVACANFGIRETSADVVHLLAAGCYVNEGWTDGVMKHFADPRVAVVAPLLVDALDPTRALAASLSYSAGGVRHATTRSVADVLTAGVTPVLAASLAAVFYNRVTLSTVGYLSNEVGADLADIDLGLLLRYAGFVSLIDPHSKVCTPNRPLETLGAFRRAVRAERLCWRNAPIVGWLPSLAMHPWAVAGDLASHFPRPAMLASVAGHLVGAASIGSARRHHQRLADLRNTAPVPVAESLPRQVRIDKAHGGNTVRDTGEAARVA